MSMQRSRAWSIHACGVAGFVVGVWLAQRTGSMVPLALGASALLVCTASVANVLFARRLRRIPVRRADR